MKKFIKLFTALLCAVLFAAVLAACGETKPDPEKETYTVLAEYDAEQGTVALSPQKTGYEKGERVTVTVTANDKYGVEAVTINDAAITLENGSYALTVEGNTIVKATFKQVLFSVELAPLSEFAKEHGAVTLSSPAEGNTYRAGETVTVTAIPKSGYEAYVSVNGRAITATEGAYTFSVEEDSVVTANFYLEADSLPTVEGLPSSAAKMFAVLFRSRWTSVGDGTPLYIGTNKMCFGEHAISSVTTRGDGTDEQEYLFEIDGVSYGLSWLSYSYSQGYVLHLLNYTEDRQTYFVKDPLPAVEIEEHFEGNWILEHGETKLIIEGNNINFGGKDADLVVDLGYYEKSLDEEPAPIKSHMYYFFVEGRAYRLGWYPDGSNPTVNGYTYIEDIERIYNFSAAFQGTWKSLNGDVEIVITEQTLTVNGEAVAVDGYNEYMFVIELDGVEYEARIYLGSDYLLQFSHYELNDMGVATSVSFLYFVGSGLSEVTVDPSLYGVWTANGVDDFTVSEEGIYWGEDRVVVISAGESRSDGFVYTVAVRNDVYTLSLLDLWAAWEDEADVPEGTPHYLFTLDGNGNTYEFNAAQSE